jgi:4-hydroxy-4-methyl-2-oxoglutarate aldolase
MDYVELISRLEKLDTCAVSDAMDSLDLAGVAEGIQRRSTRQKMAGRVRTMQLAAGKQADRAAPHLGTRSIEEADDTDVIVIEQLTGINAACWGGILSEAAHHKHIRGVVVEGPVRDVDEINETGIPVFSRSVTPTSARGRIHESAVNVPVSIGGIAVEPGDFVIADGSGVVFVPAVRAPDIIDRAETIATREQRMVELVHENKTASEIMDSKYETMLEGAE